jgi:hypothetical protein
VDPVEPSPNKSPMRMPLLRISRDTAILLASLIFLACAILLAVLFPPSGSELARALTPVATRAQATAARRRTGATGDSSPDAPANRCRPAVDRSATVSAARRQRCRSRHFHPRQNRRLRSHSRPRRSCRYRRSHLSRQAWLQPHRSHRRQRSNQRFHRQSSSNQRQNRLRRRNRSRPNRLRRPDLRRQHNRLRRALLVLRLPRPRCRSTSSEPQPTGR